MRIAVTLALTLAACTGGGHVDPADRDHVASGSVSPATTGPVYVVWVSDDGSGDYAYLYGSGSSDGSSFVVGLDDPVPTAATFNGSFGVGQPFLAPDSYHPAQGRVADADTAAFDAAFKGFAGNYAFIFRGNINATDIPWLGAFPMGVSCGKCTAEGGFEPVACDQMEMIVAPTDQLPACPWT